MRPVKSERLLQLKLICRALTLIGCALLITSCVSLGSSALIRQQELTQPDPPQRILPSTTKEMCPLYVLPQGQVSLADLEIAYVVRGAQVAMCNTQRDLAVQVHEGEHQDEAAWRAKRVSRVCPWYKFGTCK